MRFSFTPEQDAFRQELQEFLRTELNGERPLDTFDQEFSRKLAKRGWIGLAWPKEYGGQGLGSIEQMIYTEEMILHDAPRGFHFTAERQVGPSLIRHGTEEQKREWIKAIMQAEVSFALGLSEPESGSDLASAKTRAVRDGDDYIVNGQKIWTSAGHLADHIWLVVRTDPDAPKHKGISCLMADLKAPGVTVRPLYDMTDGHHFNEVFFEDVRVPVNRRVGEENTGWYILAEHLDFERSGIERLVDLERLFRRVIDEARLRAKDGSLSPGVRNRLAEMYIEIEVGRLMCYRTAWLQSVGRVPNYEASMAKVYGTEWSQRMTAAAMNLMGMDGIAMRPGTLGDAVRHSYLNAVSRTLAGGTSEIQRNIVATRGLGLPRS